MLTQPYPPSGEESLWASIRSSWSDTPEITHESEEVPESTHGPRSSAASTGFMYVKS